MPVLSVIDRDSIRAKPQNRDVDEFFSKTGTLMSSSAKPGR
jgi:hypothetical protein